MQTAGRGGGGVTLLGREGAGGGYVLRVRVARDCAVVFGGYGGGRAVAVPAGAYAYVGSARAERGASSLGRRLVRHASRSEGRPAHRIRPALVAELLAAGLGQRTEDLLPRGAKRLHWHVDHLLDRAEAEIDRVLALRAPSGTGAGLARGGVSGTPRGSGVEARIAALLGEDAEVEALAPGLGASDAPGRSHLLRVPAEAAWWARLVRKLAAVDGDARPG